MLGILLDGGVIWALTAMLGDSDVLSTGTTIMSALAVGLTFWLSALFLGPAIGLFALFPGVLVAGLIFLLVCQLPPSRAGAATAILTVYKIALTLLFAAMFSRG